MPKPKRAYDPRSAAPVLRYMGGSVEGVPARDLSDADLARAAWARSAERPASPLDVPAEEALALAAALVASGAYQPSEPAAPAPDSEDNQ
jgi:hypothetical protein